MAHLVEFKKVDNTDVLFYFQFHTDDDVAGAGASSSTQLSPDKWLSLHNWISMFAKLNSFVSANLRADNDANHKPAASSSYIRRQNFELTNTQLSYTVDWLAVDQSPTGQHAAALYNRRPPHALHTHFAHVQVQPTTLTKTRRHLAELEARIKELKNSNNKPSTYVASAPRSRLAAIPTPSSSGRDAKQPDTTGAPSAAGQPVDKRATSTDVKYIPNAVCGSSATEAVQYKPSRLAGKGSTHPRYVPSKVSPPRKAAPIYVPSTTSSDSDKDTDLSHQTPRRFKKSAPSGGGGGGGGRGGASGSQQPTRCNARRRQLARKRSHSSDMSDGELEATAPVGRTDKPGSPAGSGGRQTTASSRNMSRTKKTDDVAKPTSCPKSAAPVVHQIAVAQMDALAARREMDSPRELLKPKLLPDVEVIDLKHLTMPAITELFAASEPRLRAIFDKFCDGPIIEVKCPPDISEIAANSMLDKSQKEHMVETLLQTFCGIEDWISYGDFMRAKMMPEWCVDLFMKTYGFTRVEATRRMRQQERIAQAHVEVMEDSMDSI